MNDPATSRRHARFEVRDRCFILVDLGSANGSAIDGVRVVLEQPLTNGCTIAIGQNQIEVAIQLGELRVRRRPSLLRAGGRRARP